MARPPPRPLAIDRLGSEVEITGADAEAGKLVLGATVSHVEAKGLIKKYRLLHVVGGQGDSVDGFNHGLSRASAFSIKKTFGYRL